ncbi:uncharacterized protein DNG_02560 [Cephalotrichum gorgonifer]|uniref:Glycoside hydrolase family 2 protein n=1 Tax=Cephalotrichum gorgonifer TaxID=2041049 RepID=A0AAE8MVA2_9PEZI|nr:uncharacterized protein DNG_02560 [Cephalotrichum gorgonifer]
MPFPSVATNTLRLGLVGILLSCLPAGVIGLATPSHDALHAASGRERVSINADWRFQRFTSNPDDLTYDKLKPWMLPCANNFINDESLHTTRPEEDLAPVDFAQADFDDGEWEALSLPHDWAIKGPFYEGEDTPVPGDMGRLPIQGVGWYRRTITIEKADAGKAVYLEIDGAMSYAAVWLNGNLVGGWPYGYASFRLDLTPYIKPGDNQLAIRLDQALASSRWYPGSGLYRNVWLTKVNPTHVGQFGTWISSSKVSSDSATVDLTVQIENAATKGKGEKVEVTTDVYELDAATGKPGAKVGQFPKKTVNVGAGKIAETSGSIEIKNPKLWGPVPSQTPNLHVAITRVYSGKKEIDSYETTFGIRSLEYKNDGLWVNGERIYLQGVCQHHDLGSLGSAFNVIAAERQLDMLQEMGSNALRTSHNPPAPELLQLADIKGILVLDESFDTWRHHKVDNDFQIIFDDWSEPDLRAFVRRDRNHPSIWAWSYGNEVWEQGEGATGVAVAERLHDILREEDHTRKSALGMNTAAPGSDFTAKVDLIGLNYQGEGRNNGDEPTFQTFRDLWPDKMIFSSESSSVVSSRGTYLFPVTDKNSLQVDINGTGADPATQQVSSYELYGVPWGASPDKVFAAQDAHPYVAGEFVWTGWDYIGEPTPYSSSRSSYFGIIDLAGNRKDRFYLYQAHWNPTVKMAHILPHWNWPDRVGEVTPVHVFSSGDEAELFINEKSQGRKKKGEGEYRFRWDDVTYEAGEVHVVTYKDGEEWAEATVRTTGEATQLQLSTYQDRTSIKGDGEDLIFVNVAVVDDNGDFVANAEPKLTFSIEGPGEIVSTDNGDPTDFTPFPSKEREAFRGRALAIVKANRGGSGQITVSVEADGLKSGEISVTVE